MKNKTYKILVYTGWSLWLIAIVLLVGAIIKRFI